MLFSSNEFFRSQSRKGAKFGHGMLEAMGSHEVFSQAETEKCHLVSVFHKRINPSRLCGFARDILVLAWPDYDDDKDYDYEQESR